MRRIALVMVMVLLLSGTVFAENIPVVGHTDGYQLDKPSSITTWQTDIPWWDFGRGFAAGKHDGYKTVLEAQSICEVGMSHYRADVKALWHFRGGYDGFAGIKPNVEVWGQLVTYVLTGTGKGTAKITFGVTDLTTGTEAVSRTLMDEESRELVSDTMGQRKELENRIKERYGWWEYVPMQEGHEYVAEIKLWTSCWSKGLYSVRSDFSRGTISTADNPLIGRVVVRGLDFWIP